jgi:hypothetical protein
MKKDFEKRLIALETAIKNESKSGLWITMTNNKVRIDNGRHRGSERIFDTVFEAARYIETEIDKHENAYGSINVTDICDLFEESETLRSVISAIIPLETFKEKSGILFGCLKTSDPADINLWMVGSLLQNFNTSGFMQRLNADEVNDFDNRLFLVCFDLFCWNREGDMEKLIGEFTRLFLSVSKGTKMQVESAGIASDY